MQEFHLKYTEQFNSTINEVYFRVVQYHSATETIVN